MQINDKIPGKIKSTFQNLIFLMNSLNVESSEDISPYATFQLAESSAMMQPHPGGANTLLHSFMYHERAMTEGCASPNPAQLMRKLQQSPYYNIVSPVLIDNMKIHIKFNLAHETFA